MALETKNYEKRIPIPKTNYNTSRFSKLRYI